MSARPLISVILPVHNAGSFLLPALNSLSSQTIKDFEIIAIDDGSTDNSLDILQSYQLIDKRLKVISRENKGLVATLNEGIAASQGEFIARMDADDISLPQRFEMQLARLHETKSDFCGGAMRFIGAKRGTWIPPLTHEACEIKLLFDVCFAHPTVLGKASAFANLYYSEEYICAQDYDLWHRAWKANYRFSNVKDIVLWYRVHSRQVSSLKQQQQLSLANQVRCKHLVEMSKKLDVCIDRLECSSLNPSYTFHLSKLLTVICSDLSESDKKMVQRDFFRWSVKSATQAGVPSIWIQFCKSSRIKGCFFYTIAIWVFSIFKIRNGSFLFKLIKGTYVGATQFGARLLCLNREH